MGVIMKILIKDININYEVSGVGPPLIFLHGWGCDLHIFDKVAKQINEDFTVYQIDLPGFGKSEINEAFSLDEYANIINEFCLSLAISKPIIVGHSFGGRTSVLYASKYETYKLVLIATPGVKERFNLCKWSKIKLYKFAKKLKVNLKMGSTDYKKANGFLKDVLIKAVNRDLTLELSNIKCPTLLIYGKKDKAVPLYIGKRINNLIKGSGMVIVDKTGHFPFVERFRYFLIVLKSFLYGNKL